MALAPIAVGVKCGNDARAFIPGGGKVVAMMRVDSPVDARLFDETEFFDERVFEGRGGIGNGFGMTVVAAPAGGAEILEEGLVIDLTVEPPILHAKERSVALDAQLPSPGRRAAVRMLDLAVAIPGAIIAAPIMALVALVVFITSPGPVLYASTRYTRDAAPFRMWKFRSMVTNGDDVLAAHFVQEPGAHDEWIRHNKLQDDPRVTTVGRFIRRWSLDELPQLFNVVTGEMSAVGPRPLIKAELDRFGAALPAIGKVKSGLTGLWQVSGRSSLTFEERIVLDVVYVADRTILEDIRIVARTAGQLLKGSPGAY